MQDNFQWHNHKVRLWALSYAGKYLSQGLSDEYDPTPEESWCWGPGSTAIIFTLISPCPWPHCYNSVQTLMFVDSLPHPVKCLFLIFTPLVLINLCELLVDNNWLVHLRKFTAHDQSLVCLEALSNAAECDFGSSVWEAGRFEGFYNTGSYGSCQDQAEAGNGNTHPWCSYPSTWWASERHLTGRAGKSVGLWPVSHGMLDQEQGWRIVTVNWPPAFNKHETSISFIKKILGEQWSAILSERSQKQRATYCKIPLL